MNLHCFIAASKANCLIAVSRMCCTTTRRLRELQSESTQISRTQKKETFFYDDEKFGWKHFVVRLKWMIASSMDENDSAGGKIKSNEKEIASVCDIGFDVLRQLSIRL